MPWRKLHAHELLSHDERRLHNQGLSLRGEEEGMSPLIDPYAVQVIRAMLLMNLYPSFSDDKINVILEDWSEAEK